MAMTIVMAMKLTVIIQKRTVFACAQSSFWYVNLITILHKMCKKLLLVCHLNNEEVSSHDLYRRCSLWCYWCPNYNAEGINSLKRTIDLTNEWIPPATMVIIPDPERPVHFYTVFLFKMVVGFA